MVAGLIAAGSLAAWIYLLTGRGAFWTMRVDEPPAATGTLPSVTAIVPARDEADVIPTSIRSLLAQDYAGSLHIVVVDDQSRDETAVVAAQSGAADRLTVVAAGPLPAGWKGKLWAVSEGIGAASACDYFLLTDADIAHDPGNLRGLIARAEADGLALASVMVKLRCDSLAERILIPAFSFFFFMLYPPAWVANANRGTAAAAGGCMLVRSDVLASIGGIAAIRDELIDDCALARAIKARGRIWLGSTQNTVSLRGYGSWSGIARMIARSAFNQLNHSFWLLVLVILGMAVTYLAPPVLLAFGGWAAWMGGAAWLAMSVAYWPTLRFYGLSPLWAPFLPAVAAFYLVATIWSAIQYWQGRGGEWKGRVQDSG